MNTTGEKNKPLYKYSEFGLAVGVLVILFVLIVPLPTFLLDIFITINISLSFLVLLVTLHVRRALEISAYPSLLLFLTLFRLALNVASTRLILMHAEAGQVITSFGNFVVGGNVVIGLVVFIILTVIQFIVITKGATRVSEVAARFTLDAMPGKQMSIDADLNSGAITEEEAKARRLDISQEAEFYGSMDGASKFVSGDAIAGIVITIINIAGGIVIGSMMQGMKINDAMSTYTLLTVGDGLVTQIPSLINAISAALLITKSSSKSSLGKDLSSQLLTVPRALGLAAGILFIFGLIPGMPKISFFIISAIFGFLFVVTRKNPSGRKTEKYVEGIESAGEKTKQISEPEDEFEGLLHVDRMGIEVGYKLVPLVDPKKAGGVLSRINSLRKQLAREIGIIIPPIRLRDNLQLPSNGYSIKIKGQVVDKGELMPDSYLALGDDETDPIDGVRTTDPAYGLPGVWIAESKKESAEAAGYTIIDPTSVLVTHLTEIIKSHAYEIVTREDIQKLIDTTKKDSPTLVNELTPAVLTLGVVQEVVKNLLRERISVKDFVTILETLIDNAPTTKDPEALTEFVRQRLCRTLCGQYQSESNKISTISFEPGLEQEIINSIHDMGNKSVLALEPNYAQRIIDAIAEVVSKTCATSNSAVLLTSSSLRNHIRKLTETALPFLPVLSYKEIAPGIQIESLGIVSLTNEN
ncbi:flagellar biosynthesis pathway, component [Candidatus Scalindua japonica]|uniref:Flagellar biosynthesis protein FlhA n=1 Tax=Candidatus Scalindua japonica TaxID=1284222 RepID=A0A286TW29_9BACT|nr:flagellar biosynthesis protein FlhA [Candidatus Scalindua japonica]GAX60031.1 flagellar biosynthesis pathway, component [Candidatus Scalindua japonica]